MWFLLLYMSHAFMYTEGFRLPITARAHDGLKTPYANIKGKHIYLEILGRQSLCLPACRPTRVSSTNTVCLLPTTPLFFPGNLQK